MAWLVEDAFDEFLAAINLPGNHRELANKRKDWIVSRLRPTFEILDAFAMGSIPKYTALKDHADLDVLVVLHFGKHIEGKSPDRVLDEVRKALGPGAGGVRRNGQAVTMRFESWPDVDVVPASVTWADRRRRKSSTTRFLTCTRASGGGRGRDCTPPGSSRQPVMPVPAFVG